MLHKPANAVDINNNLLDYGTDSIKLFELCGLLEAEFQIIVEPAMLYEHQSIQDLINLISSHQVNTDELKVNDDRHPLKIAVCASFTAEPLSEGLEFIMNKCHYNTKIEYAPYNQIIQELLKRISFFNEFHAGPRIILFRIEDFFRFEKGVVLKRTALDTIASVVEGLKLTTSYNKQPVIFCLCPHTPKNVQQLGLSSDIDELDDFLLSKLHQISGVYVLDLRNVKRTYHLNTISDSAREDLGHIPYGRDFYLLMAMEIARKCLGLLSPPKKVIVLDCDNTLWGGVVAEEGFNGVVIDKGRQSLQELLIELHDAGILLCLCSKNNEADVWEVFDNNPDMILKKEHIMSHRLNWNSKSANIIEIANELNLGTDSFIFIDDNPLEIHDVEKNLPEITWILAPTDDQELYGFYSHHFVFETNKLTREDLLRQESYKQNKKRMELKQTTLSFEDFLQSLNLKIDITPLEAQDIPRAAQLTQKTNQFNATTIRYQESEIKQMMSQPERLIFSIKVKDKFGDYGFVGLLILHFNNEGCNVETFLMSCRVLGRRIEHEMLRFLSQQALARGINKVKLHLIQTDRNMPIKLFYDSLGIPWSTQNDLHYLYLNANEINSLLDKAINLNPEDVPRETSEKKSAATSQKNTSEALMKLAQLKGNINELHAWINHETNKPRPDLSTSFIAPKTMWQKLITQYVGEILHLNQIGIQDNFYELGMTSLHSAELIARLGMHNIPSSISLQSMENQTAFALAELIENGNQANPHNKENFSLEDDCILPMDLKAPQNGIPRSNTLNTILFTGATGYLGAFFIREWMSQTQVNIICLTRGNSNLEAMEKVRANLAHYEIPWLDDYNVRIQCVCGDIAKPYLGLNKNQWNELTHQVDAVFHCAAWVNFSYPYRYLKPMNVDSIYHILKFVTANPSKAIKLHFISTFGVTMSPGYRNTIIYENDELTHCEGLLNGYEQTKYVGDKIIWNAMKTRGIQACIYRPALVTGVGLTGTYHKLNEFFPSFIKGCIQMGSMPDLDTVVEFAPVDFITKAIVAIAKNPENMNKAYFSLHPSPRKPSDLIDTLIMRGYPIRALPWDIWKKQFLQQNLNTLRNNGLFPFIDFIRLISTEQAYFPQVNKSQFNQAISKEHLEWPDQIALFNKYLDYFEKIGYITPPETGRPS